MNRKTLVIVLVSFAGLLGALIVVLHVARTVKRAEAVSMLRELQSDQIAKVLVDRSHPLVKGLPIALRSSEKEIRLKAAWAMGEIGDEAYVRDLSAALSDKSELVQDAAGNALVKMGGPVASLLVEHVAKLDIPIDSKRFGKVLHRVGYRGQEQRLIGLLDDPKMDTRMHAASLLGDLEVNDAVAPLCAILTHDSNDVALHAAGALGTIGDSSAVPALIGALEAREDLLVKRRAAWALGEIGTPNAAGPLLRTAVSADTSLAIRSIVSLGKIRTPTAAEPIAQAISRKGVFWETHKTRIESAFVAVIASQDSLLRRYATAADPDLRYLAVASMQRRPQPYVAELREAAKKGEYRTRKIAIQGLGAAGNDAFVTLLELTSGNDFYIVRDAVQALGAVGDPRAFSALLRAAAGRSGFSEFQNRTIRMDAIGAMAQMGERRAIPYLRELLKSEKDRAVRCVTVEALGTLGDTGAREQLESILAQPDSVMAGRIHDVFEWDTRVSAARALGKIGDRASAAKLREVVSSSNRELRKAATDALAALGDTVSVTKESQSPSP